MALDRGANLRMAGQLPSPRSGLRDQSTHERGLDQNRHDPPYGAKARLSILRQVLNDKAAIGSDTGSPFAISSFLAGSIFFSRAVIDLSESASRLSAISVMNSRMA